MIYTRWSEEAGRGKKNNIEKASRLRRSLSRLAISPYRQLVLSKSLRGVENNLRHEALSKGYALYGLAQMASPTRV